MTMRFAVYAFIIAVGIVLALGTLAGAHEWYDGNCCSETDCRPTAKGEVVRRDDGWFIVPTGELITWGDPRIKQSMDPLMHRCVFNNSMPQYYVQGVPTGPKRPGDTRCLYVATPGG